MTAPERLAAFIQQAYDGRRRCRQPSDVIQTLKSSPLGMQRDADRAAGVAGRELSSREE